MYVQDYNQMLGRSNIQQRITLTAYIKNDGVWVCPSKRMTYEEPNGCPPHANGNVHTGTTYCFDQGALGLADASVEDPANKIVFAEGRSACSYLFSCTNCHGYDDTIRTWLGDWHNEGVNAAFVDGHVKWMKKTMFDNPSLWLGYGR